MKKNIHIQPGGYGFLIEEDAYAALQAWLDKVKSNLASDPYREEIIRDLEHRLAELWFEKHQSQTPLQISDVQKAIEILGEPESVANNTNAEEKSKSTAHPEEKIKKRLFRDPDDFVLGGVCSGIAAYLNVDPVFVRLAAVLLLFVAGTSFWVYIILWIIIPEAKTYSQKLQMRGEPWNWDNLREEVRKKSTHISNESKGFFSKLRRKPVAQSIMHTLVRIFSVICGAFLLFLGVIFLVALMSVIIGSIHFIGFPGYNFIADLLNDHISFFWIKVWIYVLLGSLFLFFTYLGFKLTFKIRGSKWALPLITALFFIGILGIGIQSLRVYEFLNRHQKITEEFNIPLKTDTLYLKYAKHNKQNIRFKKISINMGHHLYSLSYANSDDEKLYIQLPVEIIRTQDSVIKLKVEHKLYAGIAAPTSKTGSFVTIAEKNVLLLNSIVEVEDKAELLDLKKIKLYIPGNITLIEETRNDILEIEETEIENKQDKDEDEDKSNEGDEVSISVNDEDIIKINAGKENVLINGKNVKLSVEKKGEKEKVNIQLNPKNKKDEAGN
ncbi:MAG: PspC domain-containing protein [Bacteroidia bacterium]|nr:PspC domain-containing protein [Bacteroidia bacterium]